MEETFEEYKDWLQDEPDSYTKQTYYKAQAKLEKVKPYEDKLVRWMLINFEDYKDWIQHESEVLQKF